MFIHDTLAWWREASVPSSSNDGCLFIKIIIKIKNKFKFFCTDVYVDNKFLFRISCGVGLLIELWKITKVSDVSFDFENPVMGLIPRLIVSIFCIPSHYKYILLKNDNIDQIKISMVPLWIRHCNHYNAGHLNYTSVSAFLLWQILIFRRYPPSSFLTGPPPSLLFTAFIHCLIICYVQIVERKDYKNSGTKEFDRMAFKYLGRYFLLI